MRSTVACNNIRQGGAKKRLIELTTNTFPKEPNFDKKNLDGYFVVEKFEPVALEKFEFQNQQNMKINWSVWPFWGRGIPIQEKKIVQYNSQVNI